MNKKESELKAPVGQLFSRVYIDQGSPGPDSKLFRNRLEAYLSNNLRDDLDGIASHMKQEGGLVVPWSGNWYNYADFFTKAPIEHVLNAITLIWGCLSKPKPVPLGRPYPLQSQPKSTKAEEWHAFVSRALREESLGYRLDKRCGVHYFVDEEFERNRSSALGCLNAPRYSGVQSAFEAAHKYLDQHPADTKASVRSAFEALEVLSRLMLPDSKNLNKFLVKNDLKRLALANAADRVEHETMEKLFDGLAEFVDGLHNYRHGQGLEQPVAPSLTLTVYVVSTVAAAIRVLVTVSESKVPIA